MEKVRLTLTVRPVWPCRLMLACHPWGSLACPALGAFQVQSHLHSYLSQERHFRSVSLESGVFESLFSLWLCLQVAGSCSCQKWLSPEQDLGVFLQEWMQGLTATAAAAKSLQSCPILCNPIDGSPPGILQARTLEWAGLTTQSQTQGRQLITSAFPLIFIIFLTPKTFCIGV